MFTANYGAGSIMNRKWAVDLRTVQRTPSNRDWLDEPIGLTASGAQRYKSAGSGAAALNIIATEVGTVNTFLNTLYMCHKWKTTFCAEQELLIMVKRCRLKSHRLYRLAEQCLPGTEILKTSLPKKS